jgi:DNA-binding response OmpR family regulator
LAAYAAEVATVLIVDDDPTVLEVLTTYLTHAGHGVAVAEDGPAALVAAAEHDPDLVVLDLMLPGFDGLEVASRLRDVSPALPIIMLTARGEEEDRIAGLSSGADDYVTKPFSARELVLRVESVLRRSGSSADQTGVVSDGNLRVDPLARTASLDGADLHLTAREFDLLAHFLAHPGVAFTREELMSQVWGWDIGDLTTVTVHVSRLRNKVEEDPAEPRRLVTVWGVGYRWEARNGT